MVYADNAATTRVSETARNAYFFALDSFGNPSSMHRAGTTAQQLLNESREKMARCFDCSASEIYFTSGGTESDNMAILGAAAIGEKRRKKHIVSTVIEHHAVLHTLDYLKERGFEVTLVGVDEYGYVRVKDVEDAIRDDTCLVSVMYANNEIGTIQPIQEIGEICRSRGVLFHTDAVQAVGHIPIDVVASNIDMMSLSAHKFHGVKGVGALYIRNGITLLPLIHGGAQERGMRAGTENVPGICAMAEALEESCREMKKNIRITEMRDELIRRISDIDGLQINGGLQSRLPGNLNITIDGINSNALLLLLDEQGICVSSGSACTTGTLEPSHVITAIRHGSSISKEAIRITLDEYNTMDEVRIIEQALKNAVAQLKQFS